MREKILADCPHIAYPEEALAYQAGCCALSGGGLFAGETEDGPVCACAEGDGAGLVVYKELLGTKLRTVLPYLPRMVPGERFLVRGPLAQRPAASGGWQFGMLKWLSRIGRRPGTGPAPPILDLHLTKILHFLRCRGHLMRPRPFLGKSIDFLNGMFCFSHTTVFCCGNIHKKHACALLELCYAIHEEGKTEPLP